ncbi:MAG: RDD family protein [Nitriliruptoraceae bacterium]
MAQPPPPAPTPSGASGPSGGGQPADLLNRFLAKLIDGVLLAIVNTIIVSTLLVGSMMGAGGTSRSGMNFIGGFSGTGFVAGVVSALIVVGYFVLMESSRGQTIGKMLLKLKVEGPAGGNPNMNVAIKRNAWMLLSIVPVVGGVAQFVVAIVIAITISNSATNTGWHDDFAGGTRVVKLA